MVKEDVPEKSRPWQPAGLGRCTDRGSASMGPKEGDWGKKEKGAGTVLSVALGALDRSDWERGKGMKGLGEKGKATGTPIGRGV